MQSNIVQNRVRRGVPAGGQFAPTPRREATGVELTEDPSAEAVLAHARHWGTLFARRYGVDVTEVVGEAAVRFYERRASLGARVQRNDAAYVRTLTRNIAIQALGADRSYVRQAWRSYQARCDAAMQRLGRELTSVEEDEIAASVIAAQEPRRRAPGDFHRKRQISSLDATPERAFDRAAPASSAAGELGALGAKVEQLAASGDRVEVRHLAWDALAELSGAPRVEEGSVTERDAAASRRIVAAAGGAAALAGSHVAGTASPEHAAALFAPFGHLDDDAKAQVADVLCRHRRMADQLWDLALRAATKKRGASVGSA